MKHVLALFFIITFSETTFADCVNPVGIAGQQIYDQTDNQMKFCDGGSWWILKNLPIGSKDLETNFQLCSASIEGVIRYNTLREVVEVCDGNGWKLIVSSGANTDPDPDAFSFTDLTNQEMGVSVVSDTVTLSNFQEAVLASVSGDGTAELQVNGGNWQQASLVKSGDQVRLRVSTAVAASTAKNIVVSIGSTSDTWTVTTKANGTRIFYTASTYAANTLGGLLGAHSICQTEADTQTYGGTWKALLGSEQENPSDFLTITYPVANACDGSLVESSGLFSTNLEGRLKRAGSCTMGSEYVWTGVDAGGDAITNLTCDSWYSELGSGQLGRMTYTTSSWLNFSTGGCTISNYLICIEQAPETPPSSGPGAFSFTDLTNQELVKGILSNTVTLTGFAGSLEATAVGPGNPLLSVNGGPFIEGPVSVVDNDTLRIKISSLLKVDYQHDILISVGTTSDTWSVTTKSASLKIFFTASTYAATTIASLAGGDALCQAEASTHSFPGTWKSILSDQSVNAKDRLTLSYPIANACDDSVVELNDLWGSSNEALIRRGDNCTSGSNYVSTGTLSNGNKDAALTCTSWTSSSGSQRVGRMSYTSSSWVAFSTGSCGTSYHLICISQ